jgi:osmotically inducible lipoprotein OsmB
MCNSGFIYWRLIMKTATLGKIGAIGVLALALGGCSTWDNMSSRQKGAVTGAGVGGVAGAAITGGSVLGTVGGAAIGGVVGDQIGKRQ